MVSEGGPRGRRHHPRRRGKGRRVSFSARGGLNVNWVRGPRGLRLGRRRRFGGHHHGGLIRHVTAIYKLLTKKKKQQPLTPAQAAVAAKAAKAVKAAKGSPNPQPGHGTPKPNPHRGRGRPFLPGQRGRGGKLPVRLRHLPVRKYAVMQTNFGRNIAVPVRGPAYRVGAAGGARSRYGVGRRPRHDTRFTVGAGRPPAQLRANRLTSRRRGH